jgi:hypothetical protein
MMKQVDAAHYAFTSYESAERFTSYYHQISAVLELHPRRMLEVGVGNRILLDIAKRQGIEAYGMDIDPALRPSVCGSVLHIPLADEAVDVAAAFQMLEHLPFDVFEAALLELARVSKEGVVISLPEFGNAGLVMTIPFVRKLRLAFGAFPIWKPKHRFDGEHHWEINKRGYELCRIIETIHRCGLVCQRTWLNQHNPYHRFFILRKAPNAQAPDFGASQSPP